MKKLICIICLCVGLLGVALPVTLASGAEDEGCVSAKSVARTEIWKAITSGAAGSATVAIMERGKLVYAEGFGMADREKSIPVDKNTLFNIGSISKVHCTTAILLLVDEGKISLDQPVIAYLPEFTMADERYKEISVRMLLNHSSGLPGTVGPNSFGFAYHTDFYKDVLEILAQSKVKHRPGEMAIYCNDGFTLAEMIVARVSGETYPAFLARRISKPLALTNTGLGVGQRPATATIAKYYTSDGKAEPPEVVSLLGSGGLAATPEDLCKFADSFSAEGHPLLSPRELSESKTEQPTAFSDKLKGLRLTYGLGWDFANVGPYKEQGITVLGKTGGTGNYTSMLYVVPDKRISVAVLATGAHSGAAEIADAVLAAYLIERGLLAKKDQPQQPPLKALPAPLELKEYEGYYCDGNELVRMEIDLEKGLLKRYALEGSTETALPAIVYNGGQFHKENNAVYFTTVEGKRYFLQRSAIFGVDMVAGQRVEGAAEPKQLNVVVDGKQWLRRNVKAYEGTMGLTGHVITSRLVQALPGYVDFGGVKLIEATDFAGMPVQSMRDLTELKLFSVDGATWAWISGMLFMPAELAKPLVNGERKTVIGDKGYSEWLQLKQDAILSFAKPDNARIMVFTATGAVLHDSALTRGAVFAPAGSWLEMAGNVGDSFSVTVRGTP